MKTLYTPLTGIGIALLCFAIYWLGLSGGFIFDDYPQIVFNQAIEWKELSWNNLILAATSTASGPLGRPVAMVSFALNVYLSGLNPWAFKLANLGIHILNAWLVFALTARILNTLQMHQRPNTVFQGPWIPALAAALWAVHPLNLTAVLYVVQRMTSLSATFTLIALLTYMQLRLAPPATWRKSAAYLGLAALATVAGAYTKETALLLPVYTLAIEIFILRFRAGSEQRSRWLKIAYSSLLLVPFAYLGWKLGHDPDWLTRVHAHRPYTVIERLLTEWRALAFYLRNILIPDTTQMGIYHDDFVISRSLTAPLSTLLALLLHALLLSIAWATRKRWPLAGFAIAWFYGGHLLESTIIPLEPVFEHRNYLPMMGFCIAIAAALGAGLNHLSASPAKKGLLAVLVLLPFMAATAVRAEQWGHPIFFAIAEAEKHPQSARANFDAGRTLLVAMVNKPSLKPQLEQKAMDYFIQASNGHLELLEPFMTAYQMSAQLGTKVPDDFYPRFLKRLRYGYIPNNFASIAIGMRSMPDHPYHPLSIDQLEEIYQAALSNPRLKGQNRAHMLVSYAIFQANVLQQYEIALAALNEAIRIAPQFKDFRILAANVHLGLHNPEMAELLIASVEAVDRYDRYKEDTQNARITLKMYQEQLKQLH